MEKLRGLWATAAIAVALAASAPPLGAQEPGAVSEPPTADVLGGFEARLFWEDPEPGLSVILVLIIYPSNLGTSEGTLTCGEASGSPAHTQTHTQVWDARYDPTEVELYVHALERCSGDWVPGELFTFRLEIYQLPGYDTPVSPSDPLVVVEGAAPVGSYVSGIRPESPVVARVNVTPADPLAPGSSLPDDGSQGSSPAPGDAGGAPGGGPGDGPGDGGQVDDGSSSVSSVPQNPFGALPGSGGSGRPGGWSPAGIAILILFLILMLLSVGMPLKAAVASVLGSDVAELTTDRGLPTAGETATLARGVQRGLAASDGARPVTVSGPVRPWSRPDAEAPRSGFMLQPGQGYEVVDSTGTGPDSWVWVRPLTSGESGGWVHRSALAPWEQEIVMPSEPSRTAAWERVSFPGAFDTRDPNGATFTRREAGDYRVGPPDAAGYRPVTDGNGVPVGSIAASQVPPPPNEPLFGIPPPPPP